MYESKNILDDLKSIVTNNLSVSKDDFDVYFNYLEILKKDNYKYNVLQQLVSRKYKKSYDAEIFPEPDLFFLLSKNDGHPKGACCGITFGVSKLFSEQYLDESICKIIEGINGYKSSRKEIVELGSLISYNGQESAFYLLNRMPKLLSFLDLDIRFVLITATSKVRKILKALGMNFYILSEATIDKIDSGNQRWGRYYDNDPVTCIIDIKNYEVRNDTRYS